MLKLIKTNLMIFHYQKGLTKDVIFYKGIVFLDLKHILSKLRDQNLNQ